MINYHFAILSDRYTKCIYLICLSFVLFNRKFALSGWKFAMRTDNFQSSHRYTSLSASMSTSNHNLVFQLFLSDISKVKMSIMNIYSHIMWSLTYQWPLKRRTMS